MTQIVIGAFSVVILAFSVPAAIWLYRRERELRRTLQEQEPNLTEGEIRRRVRHIMQDR